MILPPGTSWTGGDRRTYGEVAAYVAVRSEMTPVRVRVKEANGNGRFKVPWWVLAGLAAVVFVVWFWLSRG